MASGWLNVVINNIIFFLIIVLKTSFITSKDFLNIALKELFKSMKMTTSNFNHENIKKYMLFVVLYLMYKF